MDGKEQDTIVFEADDGSPLEFSIVHEFYHDGSMFAVLQSVVTPGDTMIAEVVDPLGPEEEFIPLPLKRQQVLLDYLNKGAESD